MSAITSHLEQTDSIDSTEVICESGIGGDLGGLPVCVPDLSQTHAGLERMLWLRRTFEDLLVGRRFRVVDGSGIGANPDRLYVTIDPPFHQWDVPWMISGRDMQAFAALLGADHREGSSKMACPAWDLPAGWMLAGGTCPASAMCQSIIPAEIRLEEEARAEGQGVIVAPSTGSPEGNGHVDVRRTICQVCYAEGSQYGSPHVLVGNLLRLAFCRQLLDTGSREDYVEWVETMVRAIEGEVFEPEVMLDKRTGKQLLPFRIHSSGDFFSPRYAAAWIDVANELPNVVFWAPTRTWAAPSWLEHWRKLMPMARHSNFVVRPSTLHTGDKAPTFRDHPWHGDYVFNAAETTSLYQFEDATPLEANGRSADMRYDWGCQAYRAERAAKNCRHAVSPQGLIGCRACWVDTDLRVNFTTHR